MLAGQFKDVTELLKKNVSMRPCVTKRTHRESHQRDIIDKQCHTPLKSEKQSEKLQVFPLVLNDKVIGSEWRAKRYRMTASFVLYDRACISCQ